MNDKYLHENDMDIIRYSGGIDDVGYHAPHVTLMDCDGNSRWVFPATFTNEQITEAVRFANKTYAAGIEVGKGQVRSEIRKALRVDEC